MHTVNVSAAELLEFRRQKNLDLYSNNMKDGWFELLVQADRGITLRAKGDIADPEVYTAVQYSNKPIYLFDERRTSHDFGNAATWTTTSGSSEFLAKPATGKVFWVTFIQVRFPKNIKITSENKLCFQVYKYIDAYQTVVPVMDLRYDSVLDIVRKTNTPVQVPYDTIDDLSSEKMVEIQFVYANPETLKGSPIALHDCKGEYIRIWLEGHIPLTTTSGTPLQDETWCVINGKETYDF